MSIPRRFLPSMSSLRALEAVDRLGTAIAAADDLSLTHSAVSRQLKSLQEQLGVTLFLREGKGLRLTSAGRTYAKSVRGYLDALAQASLELRAAGDRNSLNIAMPLTFGMHWMAPHIRSFLAAHSDILVNLATRNTNVDFVGENFDLAIHFGNSDLQGMNYLPLAPNRLVPVAAPDFLPQTVCNPEDLLALPLLHLGSRPGAWESWFAQLGVTPGHLRGMLFDQFLSLADAAANGLGAALVPDFFATKEIEAGRLVQIGAAYEDAGNQYYLVWPVDAAPCQERQLFIDWIAHTIQEKV